MTSPKERLEAVGKVLPPPLILPPGVELPFPWVSIRGDRVFVSGHGAVAPDGTLAGPFGQVGTEVTVEEARVLAEQTGLSILSSLQDVLGDLSRITAWGRVFGMVNSAPGFNRQPEVINGFSELILEVFGPEVGRHSRSAVGMAALPFDIAVEIEAELSIAG